MRHSRIFRIVLTGWLIIGIVCAGYSQKIDTICVSRPDLVRKLIKAEQAKAFEQQRDVLLFGNDTLKARIAIKDIQIANLDEQISNFKNIISSKDAIITAQADQRKMFESNVAALNKEIRKQKRAKKFTAFVGILTTGIVTYLLIIK